MRSTRTALPIVILLLGVAMVCISPVQASQYVGEFCFKLRQPADPTWGPEFLTLGISLEGDSHYSVNGRWTYESGQEADADPVNGNMEIIGGRLEVTLTATPSEEVATNAGLFGTTVVQLRINPGTLSGTFLAMTNLYDIGAGTFDPPEYGAGTVERIANCVIP